MMTNCGRALSPRTLGLVVLLAGALVGPIPASAVAATAAAGAHGGGPPPAEPMRRIDDHWIVTFDGSATSKQISKARKRARAKGADVRFDYTHTVKGFAGMMPADAVAELRRNPHVQKVEADFEVHALGIEAPTPSWGLDRIDQRILPLNNSYAYTATGTGAGVTAYVIDTGIRITHNDFGGRATGGFTAINDGHGTDDCNGHGTHVAGTIGGAGYGVAKQVNLVAVRVLGCDGTGAFSGVIAGVDWVTSQHNQNGGPAVANMSVGGPASSTVDSAVSNSITAGVTYSIAAGNDNVNACTQSPGRVPAAITVGASTRTDARASFSNFGSCVDVFAPGEGITSDSIAGNSATAVLSGTSMAAPHVAGVAATYLQGSPNATPAAVAAAIRDAASEALSGIGAGSPNRLLFSGLAQPVTTPGGFTSVAPTRLLDTRSGVGAAGPVGAGGTTTVQVTGRGGLPADPAAISAVALNVTVVQPTAGGFLTVHGSGSPRPLASNLNFAPGQTVPNMVVVPVGSDGRVALFNGSGGTVHLLADVVGFFRSGTPAAAGAFGSLAPARLLDTRDGTGAPAAPLSAENAVSLQVAGRGGVPASGVSAVLLNVTATEPTRAGFLTVYGDGAALPVASNLNFGPAQTVPNLVVAPVVNGKVALYNGSTGTVHLLADVAGYFLDGTPTAPGTFGALTPARLLDTRDGTGAPATPIRPNTALLLPVTGRGGVPAGGVSSVVLNVTVTQPTAPGFLTLYGSGSALPFASNLNFSAGQTIANLVVAPVGEDGKVALFNGSGGTAHVIADVVGWFRTAP